MSLLDKKVLFVEDDEMLRVRMEKLLNMFFLYPVKTASTADEALEIFKNEIHDLIISDIKTPGKMDGLDFIKEAKKHNSDLKTIIITGFNEELYNQRAKELDINKYFVKPVTVSDILEEITNLGFTLKT